MKLGFKKWFSILGLLLAIIISLGIGTYFDLSILEGMTTGEEGEEEEEEMPEEVTEEEEEEIPEEVTEEEGEVEKMPEEVTEEEGEEEGVMPVEEVIEEKPIMSFSNMINPDSPSRKKNGEKVYDNFMNIYPRESFSLIQNF